MKKQSVPAALAFIKKKAKAYREPKRGRRTKGERVGFPLKKYIATLRELYSATAAEIAEAVNEQIPKGSRKATEKIISVWRTEEAYKESVKRHGEEFVSSIIIPRILADWEIAIQGSDVDSTAIFADKDLWSWAVRGPLIAWSIGQDPELARAVLINFGTDDMVIDTLADWLDSWIPLMKERLSAKKITRADKVKMMSMLDFVGFYVTKTRRLRK